MRPPFFGTSPMADQEIVGAGRARLSVGADVVVGGIQGAKTAVLVGCLPRRGCRVSAGSSLSALEGSPFVFGEAPPDAEVGAGLDRPLQASVADRTAATDVLGLGYLSESRSGGADGEEELGAVAVQPAPSPQSWFALRMAWSASTPAAARPLSWGV